VFIMPCLGLVLVSVMTSTETGCTVVVVYCIALCHLFFQRCLMNYQLCSWHEFSVYVLFFALKPALGKLHIAASINLFIFVLTNF
jgi:hypothetical protein